MNLRQPLAAAAVGLTVLVLAVTSIGLGASVLEHRAQARLDTTLTRPLATLLPEGQVHDVGVTDSPALLAARHDRVQQAVVHGTTGGHDVLMIVREYSRASRHAESVSWQVDGISFAPGWNHVSDENGTYLDRARTTVGGHRYEVTASADLARVEKGQSVEVRAGALTVDGSPLRLADAPASVRSELAPVRFAVPDPQAHAQVRSIWFDEQGAGVELYARDVSARRA